MSDTMTPEQERRLEALAVETGQTPGALITQAMNRYLDDMERQIEVVQRAEEEAERDGWLTTDEVFQGLHRDLDKTA